MVDKKVSEMIRLQTKSPGEKNRTKNASPFNTPEEIIEQDILDRLYGNPNASPYSITAKNQINYINEAVLVSLIRYVLELEVCLLAIKEEKLKIDIREATKETRALNEEESRQLQESLNRIAQEQLNARRIMQEIADMNKWLRSLDESRESIRIISAHLDNTYNIIAAVTIQHYTNIAKECSYENTINLGANILSELLHPERGAVSTELLVSSKQVSNYLATIMSKLLVEKRYISEQISSLEKEQGELYIRELLRREYSKIVKPEFVEKYVEKSTQTNRYKEIVQNITSEICQKGEKKKSRQEIKVHVDEARIDEKKLDIHKENESQAVQYLGGKAQKTTIEKQQVAVEKQGVAVEKQEATVEKQASTKEKKIILDTGCKLSSYKQAMFNDITQKKSASKLYNEYKKYSDKGESLEGAKEDSQNVKQETFPEIDTHTAPKQSSTPTQQNSSIDDELEDMYKPNKPGVS